MNMQTTNDFHSRAMLVTLSVSQWSARKIDRKASQEVASNHGVVSSKGAYYKSLVEGGTLDQIKVKVGEIRTYHYHMTLPWADNGPRVLSNLAYVDYMQRMGQLKNEFDTLVEAFQVEYPALRQEAKRLLGTLFNDADYPEVVEVSGKFDFRLGVTPLPKGEDFRCDIGADEVGRIRAEIEANTVEAAKQSVREAFDRLAKVVEAFVDRLGDEKTIFRDSLVDNARSLAEVLPVLNFTADPKLTELAEQLKTKLCAFEADALRSDPSKRRQAYNDAVAMKKDLLGFFGGSL